MATDFQELRRLSGLRMIDLIRSTRIQKVVEESSNVKSFYFRDDESMSSLPGQFAMVWLPCVGEFPMSLSLRSSNGLVSIGVKAMGEGSKKLYECKEDDLIGIRGPYGNYFDLASKKMKRVLLVGGGTGMVPMVVLASELARRKLIRAKMVVGAKTKDELPFLKISRKLLGRENIFPSTDDGSLGFKGLATEQAETMIKEEKFDQIFSCGPEKMLFSLHEIAIKYRIPVQFSLERIMKCGIGICGSCTIGDLVLCKDGPVLDDNGLSRANKEFGISHRDKTGTLVLG